MSFHFNSCFYTSFSIPNALDIVNYQIYNVQILMNVWRALTTVQRNVSMKKGPSDVDVQLAIGSRMTKQAVMVCTLFGVQ